MSLDADRCWQALKSRDARFDGRFFTCVTSTGVFCRPVCPARTPLRRNCRFLPSAAAALEAGFRPCLRCRPETSPGAPAWNGTSTLVTRALRLIEGGALDRGDVAQLAARLGVGARHLRRLFDEHLGASPQSVAIARRLLLAKSLLNETKLSIGRIATAAGFGSDRRFREAFREAYGRSPSTCRDSAAASGLELSLGYRPPYDWESLLAFLRKRAVAGVERVDEHSYSRGFELGEARGGFRVSRNADRHALDVSVECDDLAALPRILARIRRMFDLSCDPAAAANGLSAKPRMAKLVAARPGLRIPGTWDAFEAAVRAILGQQVSVEAGVKAVTKLVALCDATGAFPSPQAVLGADLEGLGGPARRRSALRSLAEAFAARTIPTDGDFERARAALEALPGVGPWTAHYVSMRALGDPDAFPASDLVLRRAWGATSKQLSAAAEAWRPWRAYAAVHLWRSQS